MATWVPSRGRANDHIITDAGTTAPPCLSSRSVTATALDHADGARFGVLMDKGDGIPAWRSGRFEPHQPGRYSKAEHSTETSSAPTSSHGPRFDFRSVLMDQGDGNPAWRSGCFDVHGPDPFFEGEHPTRISATPTSSHASDTHSVVIHMDHAERVDCLRDCGGLGVFKAEHPIENSVSRTSSHAAGFDIRPVHQNHAVFSKAEHPIEASSTPASSNLVRFDVRSVLMNHEDGIPPQRRGCFDLNEPGRFFRDDEHPTETSYRLNTHPVVMDMDHAEHVESQAQREGTLQHRGGLRVFKAQHATENSASQTSSHAAGFHIRSFHLLSVGRFKAGLLLMLILIASIAGTASSRPLHNSPPICPIGHQAASLHSRGHVCHTDEHTRVFSFSKAMSDHPAVAPTPATSGTVNIGCRYTADVLSILACLAPWYSILTYEEGLHIQLFRWRTGHLNIWKHMAVSSILYYMSMMIYGLSVSDLAESCNIFITNCICGCFFIILLVFLINRHKRIYQVSRGQVATVGAVCIAALVFTIPLGLAGDHVIRKNIFGLLGMALMIIMHGLRLIVVKFSWWFLFFNLSGTVSGFLWYCNRDGDKIYACIIVGGAIARTIELAISFVWLGKGESPLIGRTEVVQDGIQLAHRAQYMIDRIRQL